MSPESCPAHRPSYEAPQTCRSRGQGRKAEAAEAAKRSGHVVQHLPLAATEAVEDGRVRLGEEADIQRDAARGQRACGRRIRSHGSPEQKPRTEGSLGHSATHLLLDEGGSLVHSATAPPCRCRPLSCHGGSTRPSQSRSRRSRRLVLRRQFPAPPQIDVGRSAPHPPSCGAIAPHEACMWGDRPT